MFPSNVIISIMAIYLTLMSSVEGHGRLKVPPSRSSMWRYGFNTPPNYDDNALYCGGFNHQWNVNGGRCGICGDPYDGVRENEAGGKYATGTISRTYLEGSLIDASVEITADHKGWFEFRLCPHNKPQVPATHDCLNQNLLILSDGTTRYMLPSSSQSGDIHNVKLHLPAGLTCAQCVFQWKYHTGNSWGCDAVNDCGLGKGPQEEFYGCADITIVPTSGTQSTSTVGSSNTDATTTAAASSNTDSTSTLAASSNTDSTSTIAASSNTYSSTVPVPTSTHTASTTTSTEPSTTTVTTSTTTSGSVNSKVCKSAGAWEGQASMDKWCEANCAVGYCPSTHCKCVTSSATSTSSTTSQVPTTTGQNDQVCKSAGAWEGQAGMDKWCEANCAVGYCPSTHCKCVTISATSTPRQVSTTIGQNDQNCTTYKSVKNTTFENQVCEYSCLLKKSCPQDQCVCSSGQPTIQQYKGPAGVENADEYCSIKCSYGICPSECHV